MAIPNTQDVLAIAQEAGRRGEEGQPSWVVNGVTFDLNGRGYCQRFVRQCHAAAQRLHEPECSEHDYDAFPWLRGYAVEACEALEAGGEGEFGPYGPVDRPEAGDIIGISPNGYPGHIGIFLGAGQFAENTSSSRGPGTCISPIELVEHRVTGYYRALPSVREPDLAVVDLAHQVIDCSPHWEGNTILAEVRPLCEALGYEVYYRVQDDGRQRVYLKLPQED